MPSVLFVCTANVCRSPMAAALLRKRVEGDEEEWRIESAGTWALDGHSAAQRTQLVLASQGLDVSDHRARTVTAEMLRSFNLILTMEQGHKEALRAEFPELSSRIYMLSEMIGMTFDIRDPIQGNLEDFKDTARELTKILDEGFEKIRFLASLPGDPKAA